MLASRGMRVAFRLVTQSSHNGSKRAIHIPRRPPGGIPGGTTTAKNVLHQARNVINRLFYGITNVTSNPHAFTRGIHLSQPIRSQLSLPARHMVGRPFGAPSLPKAPTVPRGMTQVGLGTARNFSSARPIFQSLAENVPVTGRAIYQADLDVKKKKARRSAAGRKEQKENGEVKSKEMSRQKETLAFDQYFAEFPPSEVTTILTVPLYPAASTETPVIADQHNPASLIPMRAISEAHSAHTTHSLRITSLFLRLEQARVWQNGAHYEAFGEKDNPFPSYPGAALCTSLRIVFDGWTREQVRDVLGEAGRGWCTIREERRILNAPESVESSRAMTPVSTISLFDINEESVGHEFEMPTLDFSSAFLESHAPTPFGDISMSPLGSPAFDHVSLPGSDGSDQEWHWSEGSPMARSQTSQEETNKRIAFSAEFMTRGQDMMSNF